MKLHKFVNDYFYDGRVKYHAGLHYLPSEETAAAVAQGHAEEVDEGEQLVVHPFVDPRAIEARKATLRSQIASLQSELDGLENIPEAITPRPASWDRPQSKVEKAANDKAQAAQDRADARAEAKADRAAAER